MSRRRSFLGEFEQIGTLYVLYRLNDTKDLWNNLGRYTVKEAEQSVKLRLLARLDRYQDGPPFL